MRQASLFLRGAAILVASTILSAGSANAALVYWQNFDGGDGTEDSGSGVGGNLVTQNSATFATTSGLHNNVLDVTANTGSTRVGTTRAINSGSGSSPLNIGGSGILTNYTITMWINTTEFATAATTAASRLIVVGDSGTTDANQAGTFSLTQASANNTTGVKTGINVFLNTTNLTAAPGGSIGAVNTAGEWTFLAISFDAAAGNDFFYRGTESSQVVSTALTVSNTSLNLGASNGVVMLGNSNDGGSDAFDGLIDDVRIYNTALDATEVENIRLEAIPEPTTLVLFGVCIVGLGLVRMRRNCTSDSL